MANYQNQGMLTLKVTLKLFPLMVGAYRELPQDPRGKVAFFSPDSNADLRVLINAVDFNTIEGLIAFCKDVENRIGTSTNIEKITFGGRPAVRRTFQMKNGMKLYYVDFLVGNVAHNIAYSALQSEYEKYLPGVLKSIETYAPVVRDVSDKDVINHAVAKILRLAQNLMAEGNIDLAMELIKEGLELSPSDTGLLKLKKQIEARRKK